MQQHPPPAAPADQQGAAQDQGQKPSFAQLLQATGQGMAMLVEAAQQEGAPPEQVKGLMGVVQQFSQVVNSMGIGKEASQTVSPEGGVQGQPMSPAGV